MVESLVVYGQIIYKLCTDYFAHTNKIHSYSTHSTDYGNLYIITAKKPVVLMHCLKGSKILEFIT